MTGTLINIVAVLIGGTIGVLLGARLPRNMRDTVMSGLGLMTIVLGMGMALQSQNLLIVMGSVLVGGLLGEWWRIEDGLEAAGRWLEDRFGRPEDAAQGRSITRAFHQDTVIKPTHLLSYSIFDWLRENCPGMDFYRVLRTGGTEQSVPMTEVYRRVDRVLGTLRDYAQNNRLRLDDSLKRNDTGAIVGEALAHLKSYHRRPALVRRGDRLFHVDRNLLLYYHNRLTGFGLPTWEKPQ